MRQPKRIYREQVHDLGHRRRPLEGKDLDRREAILEAARELMLEHGAAAISIGVLADALDYPRGAITRLFPDAGDILFEILNAHLDFIADCLGRTPWSHPDRQKLRRAAYHEAAHRPDGRLRASHTLLTRDLILLPERLRKRLEEKWIILVEHLAPAYIFPAVCAMLNNPGTTIALMETIVANCPAPPDAEQPAQAAPEDPPEPQPVPQWQHLAPEPEEPAITPGSWFQPVPSIRLPDGSSHHRTRAGP